VSIQHLLSSSLHKPWCDPLRTNLERALSSGAGLLVAPMLDDRLKMSTHNTWEQRQNGTKQRGGGAILLAGAEFKSE
jgi:hypothetical protein